VGTVLIVWVLAQRIEVTNEDYVLALRWVPNLGEPVEYQNLPLYVSKQNWNRLRRESLSLIARLDKLARAPWILTAWKVKRIKTFFL
jgi:hypothetical protein